TPLLLIGADRWWIPRLGGERRGEPKPLDEEQHAPIIIAGFGRYGGIVGRLLYANGLSATVLDHDAEQVEGARRFGWGAFYGGGPTRAIARPPRAARARGRVL